MGVISGLISGVSNLIGQNSANKTNIRIARENNQTQMQMAKDNMAWQEQMMDKQNQWALDQWNRENDYNSAASQVQRFRDAGINPALAMTQGASAGQASSLQSASPASAPNIPSFQQPHVSWDASIGNGIGNLVNDTVSQITDIIKTRNELLNSASSRNLQQITGKSIDKDSDLKDLQIGLFKDTYAEQKEAVSLVNDKIQLEKEILRTQKVLNGLDAQTKTIMNKYLDDQQQLQITQSQVSIAESVMRQWQIGELTPHQISVMKSEQRRNVSQAILMDAQKNGVDIDNETAQAISGNLINQAWYNVLIAENQWKLGEQEYEYNNKLQPYTLKEAKDANSAYGRFMRHVSRLTGAIGNIWGGYTPINTPGPRRVMGFVK